MPTAPILVDRISVPAGQDIQAMEKLAKVGQRSIYCDNAPINVMPAGGGGGGEAGHGVGFDCIRWSWGRAFG